MKRFLYILCLGCIAFASPSFADPVDKNLWQETIKEYNYDEDYLEPEIEEKQEAQDLNIGEVPDFDLSGFKYVIIILVIALLVFVIAKLLSNHQSNPTLNKNVNFNDEDLDEKIHDVNLSDLLQQALQQQQYPEAVRILFLMQIKSMSDQRIIDWEKQKTNNDYYRELDQRLQPPFQKIRLLYERIWFGELNIGQDVYQEVEPTFLQFSKLLPTQ